MDNHPAFPQPLIQVAGVHDLAEARLLIDAGADLVGIPLRLTVNAEDLSEEAAAGVSRALPGRCCLITYLDDPAEINALLAYLSMDWLQLHGDISPGALARLRALRPGLRIIKSLVVGRQSLDVLLQNQRELAPMVDAFITDTYNPATGAEGATGLTHDWEISRRLCAASPVPLILAGGLRPDNVAAAIRAVGPRGVDVHTGIEDASGRKDPAATRAFVRAARSAFAGLGG